MDEHTAPVPDQPWPGATITTTPEPPRRNAKPILAAAMVGLVLGGVGGYFLPHPADAGGKPAPAASSSGPKQITVAGTLTLTGSGGDEINVSGGDCYGVGGYSDIVEGAQVIITDDSGHTLAITHLLAGTGDIYSCTFNFSTAVPAGKGYYGIEVTHRGVIKEPEASVQSVSISLGN